MLVSKVFLILFCNFMVLKMAFWLDANSVLAWKSLVTIDFPSKSRK